MKVVSLWYWVSEIWMLLDSFLMILVWVVLLMCDIEILVFMVGWMLELNRLVFRKIWLLVIEIMLVGMNVDMLFVWVLMIGSVVSELVLFLMVLLVNFFMYFLEMWVVCLSRWECR